MKKIILFVLGTTAIVILMTIGVQVNSFLTTPAETIEVTDVNNSDLPVDTTVIPDGMGEEEYIKELQKGEQGDYTLEQVDSMRKSWAEQGNDFGD